MTIFSDGIEIRFGKTVHSNLRPGFYVGIPDSYRQSFLTEDREEANAKAEEFRKITKWPDSITVREVTLADERTGEGQVRLTHFP